MGGATATADELLGRVLCHDLPGLRKGTVLTVEHLPMLAGTSEIHLAVLEPGDVHEDVAALRIAAALGTDGLRISGPVQSQVRLLARHRGLLQVDVQAVESLNRLGPVSVFTLFDGEAVAAGDEVAGCKVTPVAVGDEVLSKAEAIAASGGGVVRVIPFRPLRTYVVVTEKLKPRARELFSRAVTAKLGWYGAQVLAVREVARTPAAVSAGYAEAVDSGAELVLFAGASSIDPLDPAYRELANVGGKLLHVGAPAHPGSMIWLGVVGRAPVLGVASCAGFGRNTALDLLLPFVFAHGQADAEMLIRLGHGGLVETGAGRRFPAYDR